MKGLILFDIDHTLIKSFSSHGKAFTKGFKEVYNQDITLTPKFSGMTDQQIIIEALKEKGLKEEEIIPKLKDCTEVMIDFFSKSEVDCELMPGIPKLLEQFEEQGYLLGLVTGNLEPIGKKKMKKAGLNDFFRIGGFGSDNRNRTKLVELAIEKAKALGLNNNNIFVFGDTPHDIKAAKEAGAFAIGVATGIYSEEQLNQTDANLVITDLTDSKIFDLINHT